MNVMPYERIIMDLEDLERRKLITYRVWQTPSGAYRFSIFINTPGHPDMIISRNTHLTVREVTAFLRGRVVGRDDYARRETDEGATSCAS